MKRCTSCGMYLDDAMRFCTSCGSAELIEQPEPAEPQYAAPQYAPAWQTPAEVPANENVIAGIVGAFLFSLIGAALYFVIYQAGIIAGISGLIMFTLASFGYGLFAKSKDKTSVICIIVSVIMMLVMIYVSEYFCISFEIFQVYKQYDITIFDAVKATPEFLSDPDISAAVTEDLVFAYLFGVIAIIGNVVNALKAKKAEKAA